MITVYSPNGKIYKKYKVQFSVVETLAKNGFEKILIIKKGLGSCRKTEFFGDSEPGYKFTY